MPHIVGRAEPPTFVSAARIPHGGGPSADASGRVTLHVLGRLELLAADGSPLLGPGKPLALLAFLRSQSMRTASRAHLVDLLWSDLEPDRARANLRQALLVLRRVLPADSLVSDGDLIVLAGALECDRDAFVLAVDRGDLMAAVGHYRGDFISDVAVPGGAEFELWCDIERRHLGALFARVLESLARVDLRDGRAADAVRHARRLRDLDPSHERSWRLLIEATIAADGLASARLESDRLAELLRGEHRTAEPATAQLFSRVREVARPSAGVPGTVATPEFVGRETQLARVLGAWGGARTGHLRHVHVEALAGTGKTRLLDEACARVLATGGCVVHCGARRGEREVPFALAASLVTALARLPGSIAVAPSSMAALVALAPDVSSVFDVAADVSAGDEAMRRRIVALADLLGAVAHETSIALAVDDTHWADLSSLHLLVLAIGRLPATTRLLCVTAGREALPGDARVERISLPPLTVAHVDAMLQSLGGAGEAAWWGLFIAALRDAAGGVPFHVLQLLHAAVEKHLLTIVEDSWVAANVPALLASLDAGEAARLRIAQLSVGARAVLRVLSLGSTPDAECIARAVSTTEAAADADLSMLEVRGFARRLAGGWATAHDEISDLVLAQSDVASLQAARRGLAMGLARQPVVTVAEMRFIIALLMQAEADAEVLGVVRHWVHDGGCPGTGVLATDILPVGLPADRVAPLRRGVQRVLPRARSSRRWPAFVAVLLAAIVSGLWWVTRPVALVVVQSPVLAVFTTVPDRPAIIGIVDRLGRRLATDGIVVTVRGTPSRPAAGRVTDTTANGEAVFDSLSVGGLNPPYELTFMAPGLQPVIAKEPRDLKARLTIQSGTINGKILHGVLPSIAVRAGGRIDGDVIFTYESSAMAATIFLGGIATWVRREVDTVSIRSLITPLASGRAQAHIARVAPEVPGRYFLVWAMGAEPRAAYLFSSSNWTCGAPIWHDGDDLQDLPPDELAQAAIAGTRYGSLIRCFRDQVPSKPWKAQGVIGIAAVEVVVEPLR